MDNAQDLLSRHKGGLKGIFNKYTLSKFYGSIYFVFSLVLSILLVAAFLYAKKDPSHVYDQIGNLASVVLSAFPSLLGFSLAGYALIVGSANIGILGRMSEPNKKANGMSYFQVVSTVFALSVVIQCFTMLFAFVIHVIIGQNWNMLIDVSSYWVNIPVYAILLFLIVESVVLLANTVINIFTYSQTLHFCVRKDLEMSEEEVGIWNEIKGYIYEIIKKYVNYYE